MTGTAFRVCLFLAAVIHGSLPFAAASPPTRPGKVLLIRGIFNVFSTGIDTLAQELAAQGYDIEITPPSGSWSSALRLRDAYLADPHKGPLVLIGHSMGGRACLHISRYLESYNIPVDLVVILDSNPWTTTPNNVKRCLNLYVTNSYGVFHGSPVQAAGSAKIVNVDVTKVARPPGVDEVDHFNIDNSPWMHQIVLREIARACHLHNDRIAPAAQSAGQLPQPAVRLKPSEVPSPAGKRFIELRL